MYCLLIFGVLITAALADVDKKECEKIFDHRAVRCCKKTAELDDKFKKSEDLKECFQSIMDPALCEYDSCIAKKRGFATADNKINKEKLEELMTKDFESDADLMKDFKSQCFDGDLDVYGPKEFCDFFKMRNCLGVQLLIHCPEWNTNQACNEIKGLVQECGKSIF